MEKKSSIKKRTHSSDTAANTLGCFIVFLSLILWITGETPFRAIKFSSWSNFSELITNLFNQESIISFLLTGFILCAIFSFSYVIMAKGPAKEYIKAFLILYLLSSLVFIVSSQKTLKNYLEFAFWALVIGLIISNIIGVPKILKPALMSDFYIKVGLVLMGTEILFSNIANFGLYGIAISWTVVPLVILFMWWFGMHYLKMENPTLVMVVSVATSVCGVSAAVAAAGAINAKKTDLTFAVGISTIFTIVMMVTMPYICKALNFGELIGGAWIGNTVDSTGAVVLAGEALGPVGSQVAAMVKMIQNVLIGAISVVIAIFFAKREDKDSGKTTSAADIWKRIPKFIIGFLVMSLIFSFIVQPNLGVEATNSLIENIGTWKTWCFCLTFFCIGLETNFKELMDQIEGGKPITLYVIGQLFSLVLSLLVCYIVLSGRFFPMPNIDLY